MTVDNRSNEAAGSCSLLFIDLLQSRDDKGETE